MESAYQMKRVGLYECYTSYNLNVYLFLMKQIDKINVQIQTKIHHTYAREIYLKK